MRKGMVLLMVMAMLVTSVGCGSPDAGQAAEDTALKESSAGAAESSEVKTEEPASDEKITITYMEWGDEKVLSDAEKRFEELYPNVDIVIDNCGHVYDDYVNKLKVTMAAGEGPEVFKLQPGALLEQFKDYVEPLDSYLEKDLGDNWRDQFEEVIWPQIETEGIGWLGAPTYLSVAGSLYINQTLLDENGLEIPTTYEELAECSKVLRQKGIMPIAMGAKDDWANQDFIVTLFNQFAPGKVYEVERGNGKWTDLEMVEALKQWQKYFTDEIFVDGALGLSIYNDALDMFEAGNAAFLFNGHWNMGEYVNAEKSPKFEEDYQWAVMPLPAPQGKEPAVQVALSDMICVNKGAGDEKTKEMAYKFAMFFASEYMTEFSKTEYVMQTARKGIELSTAFYGESGPKMEESLKDMVQYSRGVRELTNVETKAELLTVLQEIAMGALSPEDGAARVQAVADEQ